MRGEPSKRQGHSLQPEPESALARAIDAGDPAEVDQAMRGLRSASAEAWAAALSEAWKRKRTDLVMISITPDRLVDAISTNHGSLVDWWLGHLIAAGSIEPVTEFARCLLSQEGEIEERARGHFFVPVAHAIALNHPGTARELLSDPSRSVQKHWMFGNAGSRIAAGDVLRRLPDDLRQTWISLLCEDEASTRLTLEQTAELIRVTRLPLGAQSRAFQVLGELGPSALRAACQEAHRSRVRNGEGREERHSSRTGSGAKSVATDANSSEGVSLHAWALGAIVLFVALGFFAFRDLPAPGIAISVGNAVELLPAPLQPLYAQLRERGCDAFSGLIRQVPAEEQGAAGRRLLLAYAQEPGLSVTEKKRLIEVSRDLLGPVDQQMVAWHLGL
jgi:hypothetical protein